MSLRSSWIVAVVAGVFLTPGCTGLFTKRAIERFAVSLQEQDLEKLKSSSSDHFEKMALRQEGSAKGLKMLKLPTGKIEIVSVEELSDGHRKVLVKVGEKDKAKDLEYRLSRDKKDRSWVVDDIIMQQDSGGGRIVERSVSEQMDLLLTCRELLISWRGDDAEEKLSFCDEDLKPLLEPLPPKWLAQMFREIAGPGTKGTFRPDARLNGETAFVVVPHPQGNLYLELTQVNKRWRLHDLAVEPSSKDSTGIRSLMKMVSALDKSSLFLAAYQKEDRKQLKDLASKHFFDQCLSGANFEEAPLPTETLLNGEYEARQFTDGTDTIKRVELLLKDDTQTYMLTLREEDQPHADAGRTTTEFRVDEVTIFETGSKDVKRLSAVFMSHAIVEAYVAALVERDVKRLKEISSSDFNHRVWDRPESKHFAIMPDPELQPGTPQIVSTNFRGDVSEVTMIQGDTPMTLMLHLANGWMVVDDVLLPALNRPTSLKSNLEAELTLHAFASAILRKNMDELLQFSADGLDRIAWRQLSEIPRLAQQVVHPMLSEVVAVKETETSTVAQTSNGEIQAEVKLVREGEKYVVHDVTLRALSNPQQQLSLMATLRQMIASGELGPTNKKTGIIQQAVAEQKIESAVKHADFEPIESSVYAK